MDGNDTRRYKTTIPLNEIEKTCQFNQNSKALLRMRHFRDTVPLS